MFLTRRFIPFSMVALVAVTVTVGVVVLLAVRPDERTELPVLGAVPEFALTGQDGDAVTSTDFRGKVWLASFIYTNCTDTCPLLTPRIRSLQVLLADEGLLDNGKVALVSFSVDPEQDTPEALRRFAARHQADLATWTFLTGDPATMRQVVTDGMRLAYQRIDGEPIHVHPDGTVHRHALGDYEVSHSNRVALVDQEGRIRAYYQGLEVPPEVMVKDVTSLLGG